MIRPMNLRQRNGFYQVWFERCKQFPNGKLVALKTSDKAEAEEIFRVLKIQWHENRVAALETGKQIKLSKFSDEYVQSRPDLSRGTLRNDSTAIRMLINIIGDVWIRTVDETHMNRFKKAYTALGRSKQTVNSYLRHLKAAFNYAAELGYIKAAPKIKPVKTGKHLPRILTKKERIKILSQARKTNPDLYRVIIFALYTGCRRAEIRGLRWENVHGDVCRIIGKGDRERIIDLLPASRKAMGAMKDIGPVFYQKHIDYYSKEFKEVAVQCGINDVHFHNLRHSSATQMVESGVPIEVIQVILGHSDIKTTQIYAQIIDKVRAKEMRKLRY